MKLKSISCDQFAGIRDRSVEFGDGVNVVVGANESGKSTLVGLISRTLFQNVKLDKRSNKDFIEKYFPSAKRGVSLAGDSVDGKLRFESDGRSYTVSKEWGADPRCSLSTEDGIIKDQDSVNEALKEALKYGEGVYKELLLSPQRGTDDALKTLLDSPDELDAKQDILNAASLAFLETGGVTTDAIEEAIDKKISELSGKHWDLERGVPVKKLGGRWAKELGKLHEAYYALEDAKAVIAERDRLEREADRTAEAFSRNDEAARKAEKEFNDLNEFASRLTLMGERKKAVSRLESDLDKFNLAINEWPQLEAELIKARALKDEKERRELKDKYDKAVLINAEISDAETVINSTLCPDPAELSAVRASEKRIAALESKLCGMNVSAVIRMFGGNTVEVRSLRTGELLDLSGDEVTITEAVNVTVPGVMEMRLAPADVDTVSIEADITKERDSLNAAYGKYSVSSIEEMDALRSRVNTARSNADTARIRLSAILGTNTFSEIQSAASADVPVRAADEIEKDITSLCGKDDVSRFITERETRLDGYTKEYGSISDLKAKAFDTAAELEKARRAAEESADIPDELKEIKDPESKLAYLKNAMEFRRGERENALKAKPAAESRLYTLIENTAGDPADELETARRDFDEKKRLLDHWLNIKRVFEEQKKGVRNAPMRDIAESLSGYLNIISGGSIASVFPDPSKLGMNIYSRDRVMDHGKLSEGTKETVSLAFRLAVLDHLIPDGGGVIVLDDPLTDMDPERAERSCEIIKECAKRHQIIFLTCREEYSEMLGGERIDL